MSKDPAARPLYTWYGDDFTGSTDVLEALALHGVKAVLFTRTPDARALAALSLIHISSPSGNRTYTPFYLVRDEAYTMYAQHG